ncbi:MAG: hypothetical protein CL878_01970 [Dehalococcoidia bacterium]|nr:hypothetical protein [Dehalococcoidia bacterium]
MPWPRWQQPKPGPRGDYYRFPDEDPEAWITWIDTVKIADTDDAAWGNFSRSFHSVPADRWPEVREKLAAALAPGTRKLRLLLEEMYRRHDRPRGDERRDYRDRRQVERQPPLGTERRVQVDRRQLARPADPAERLANAKKMLDADLIGEAEYEELKATILSSI